MNERGRGYELDNRLLVFGNECGSKERYLLLGWFHLFIQAMILLNLLCIWRYPPAAFRWLNQGRQLLLRWRAQNSEPSRSFVFFCPEPAGRSKKFKSAWRGWLAFFGSFAGIFSLN